MFSQTNDFFYSCHQISKASYLFNTYLWSSALSLNAEEQAGVQHLRP